ncbi:sorbitol dehydrogenase family protein [Paracoccus sp. S-4012]|uniref:sorbitol dehydrogenase family protein n=1 Tax=Paracoccus sp. S-4012 TaxID=2665648 RepID=UPI001E65A7B0|nr:sorbitol dehydrogenase family protein [Paracoccus sp. S-4012]
MHAQNNHGRRLGLKRRAVLAGFAAFGLGAALRPAAAQTIAVPDGFLTLSQFLTGRASLDPHHAALVHEGLSLREPALDTKAEQLLAFMQGRGIGPEVLQGALEDAGSDLASLPPLIVRAWYIGVVGEGPSAFCITFESSLMHQVVADRLMPPSLCYGPPGSWSAPPGAAGVP